MSTRRAISLDGVPPVEIEKPKPKPKTKSKRVVVHHRDRMASTIQYQSLTTSSAQITHFGNALTYYVAPTPVAAPTVFVPCKQCGQGTPKEGAKRRHGYCYPCYPDKDF